MGSFVLTEEQRSIQKTARELSQRRLPIAHLRGLRDARDPLGYSPEVWSEMAELGLLGIAFPTDFGGAGLGYAELGLVLEELGRNLAPTPLFATAVLGGAAVLLGGSETQKAEVLSRVVTGDHLLALAHEEGTRHAPHRVATRAAASGENYVISGEKTHVLDGHVADSLVVVARTSGEDESPEGLTLFLLPADSEGISITRTHLVDSRNAARVRLSGVRAPRSSILGELGGGGAVLDQVFDRGAIALSAEMLGGLCRVFEDTLAYLKTRRQFGVPIGSFQALKHRAAWMFCEIELSKSIVMEALRAVDEARPDVPRLASAAKARVSDVFSLVAAEAIQMHGGVGVTDDLDVGFFLKRAKVAAMTLGDASFHRDRFARLEGF